MGSTPARPAIEHGDGDCLPALKEESFMKNAIAFAVIFTAMLSPADGVWPLTIVRQYGTADGNADFIRAMLAAQDRHPGLVEETWVAGEMDPLDGTNIYSLAVEPSIRWREECKKRGIKFSYQALTLNHDEYGPVPGFPDEAWVVDNAGKIIRGVLCANSPIARKACYDATVAVLRGLKPDSFWGDDDLRLIKGWGSWKGTGGVCFCPRCIALFNKETSASWTRKELTDVLFGNDEPGSPVDAAKVRDAWSLFNARTLARFAGLYREAVDKVHPECRLGQQITVASSIYQGDDYSLVLSALAGNDPRGAGARPGGGYYNERSRYTFMAKAYCILREATRLRRLPYVGQICYEAENWPHVSSAKTPGAMMRECAYMLALGCDSLALYWGADMNAESDEDYAFYFDTLAAWKGFFKTIVDRSRDTFPAGLSDFNGIRERGGKNWMFKSSEEFAWFAENSIPMSAPGGKCDVVYITAKNAEKMVKGDFEKLFRGCVLVEAPAWMVLARRFPDEKVFSKISVSKIKQEALSTAKARKLELFEDTRKAGDLGFAITPHSQDVKPMSKITQMPGACGTCIVPTDRGGNIIVMQKFRESSAGFWTNYRRNAVLDAMDQCVKGGMSVRLMTGGFALPIVARTDAKGRTACVFVMNWNFGETRPLQISVRNALPGKWKVISPHGDVRFDAAYAKDGSVLFSLPGMKPGDCLFLMPEENAR